MRTLISYLTIALVSGAFLFSNAFSQAAPVSAAAVGTSPFKIEKSTITPAAVVDPTKLSLSNGPGANLPKGTRPTHPRGNVGTIAAPSSSLANVPAGALLENFNGVGSRNSAKVNFGAEFEPPDQGLCVGNGFVIEPVNSAYTIYTTKGQVVAGPFNVNKLYNEGYKQFTSDPRCFYDKATNTWFALILFISSNNQVGRTDLAVNPSGDPTKPWTVYHIDGTDPGGPGCPCFGDQPLLGIDSYNIYISTNEFSITGPNFNGAQIYAVSKSQLVALSKKVNVVHFGNLTVGSTVAASVQPALTYGASDAEYFMNSLDPFGTFDHRLGVWAMTDRQNVGKGGIPTLSRLVIGSEPYGVPPKAEQKGAKSLLDSGDDRMQQTEFINGSLWGALDTAVTIPHDNASRAGIAWFKVQPSLNDNKIGNATIQQQGYVALLGNYLLYPAIQASPEGTAAIVMTLSGATYFPSAAYTFMSANSSSFGAIHDAAPGYGSYDIKATRWGDYSWAVLDPSGEAFWMATEYIPPLNSQTKDRKVNWGTRVLSVSVEN
ncbi:MAG TPA: hypothetical protein VKU38_00795 [Ktedonobacteraceae bacterium]|nr:hypothetical protein [Ktedonobacteraceae bacterium]